MLGEPDLDFTQLTGDVASGGQVEIHETGGATGMSVRHPRLLDFYSGSCPKIVERKLS
jgi:hypothetical protein